MQSNFTEPLNLGQDRMISINELVDIVAAFAGKRIGKAYDQTKPQGVRGRNSDNSLLRRTLGWEPQISLEEGLANTYRWICEQLAARGEHVPVSAASAVAPDYLGQPASSVIPPPIPAKWAETSERRI